MLAKNYIHIIKVQLDIPSSVFNISFYIGDFIEPIIGSWITTNYYYQMSAYFAYCCSIIFATFFGWIFNDEINKQINDENQINL